MVTQRLKEIEYAIREIAVIAQEVSKSGKNVFHLNIGDPVIYDFKTPDVLTNAVAEAAREGKNNYVNSLGVEELREKISEIESKKNNIALSKDDVIITSGVTEGIYFILSGLIENKNELLMPGPTYPLYINVTKFFNGIPVEYELDEKQQWEPNVEDLRKKITNKTQAILICSPNNPTGGIYSRKEITEIIDIAGENDIPIISDEIYDQITYEKEYINPASLSKDVPIIGMNGFSKAHLITGWRLGYMYFHDPNGILSELKEAIFKFARARLCASSIAQYAALQVLKAPGEHTKELVRKLKERRDYSYKRLRQIEGLTCANADGAFYLFPHIDLGELKKWKTDKEFVIDLLRQTGICGVYGSGFGEYGKGHMRITFLPKLDLLETVYNLLEKFIAKNS